MIFLFIIIIYLMLPWKPNESLQYNAEWYAWFVAQQVLPNMKFDIKIRCSCFLNLSLSLFLHFESRKITQ